MGVHNGRYRVNNCSLHIRCDATIDDVIDVVEGNRKCAGEKRPKGGGGRERGLRKHLFVKLINANSFTESNACSPWHAQRQIVLTRQCANAFPRNFECDLSHHRTTDSVLKKIIRVRRTRRCFHPLWCQTRLDRLRHGHQYHRHPSHPSLR